MGQADYRELFTSIASSLDLPCVGIVGGQCTGKSKIITTLKRPEFGGHIHTLEELVRRERDMTGYVAPVGDSMELLAYQRMLYDQQCLSESLAKLAGSRSGCSVLVCDRTRLCGAAYLGKADPKEALAAFELLCGKREECYAAYGTIIYLGMPPQEFFEAKRPGRPYNLAMQKARILRELWQGHTGFHEFGWVEDRTEKEREIIELIQRIADGYDRTRISRADFVA
jgi:hypothetical protein